jgi:hypothetical protein
MHGSMRRREADTVPLAIRPKGPWCLPPTLQWRSSAAAKASGSVKRETYSANATR